MTKFKYGERCSIINIIFQRFVGNFTYCLLFPFLFVLTACNPSLSANNSTEIKAEAKPVQTDTKFVMSVFGAIHGSHRSSDTYSLDVMEKAIRKFNPDVIFIEIPPSSMAQAQSTFDQFGEVRERRTRAFPELTDVVFPLQKEMVFQLVATAAWTRELADNRSAVLKRLSNDLERRSQWNEHIAAQRTLNRVQRGKSDDPFYIHSERYDAEVKTAQTPYEQYFDADIGAGGWGPINDAHIALMTNALDDLKAKDAAKQQRILVVFGAWHKYKILEAMQKRDDVTLLDAKPFFE